MIFTRENHFQIAFTSLNGLYSNNLETLLKKIPNQCLLQIMSLLETRWANTKYGKQTFSYAGPKLWNMLQYAESERRGEIRERH